MDLIPPTAVNASGKIAVAIFSSPTSPDLASLVSIETLAEWIRSDESLRLQVEAVRSEVDPERKKRLKCSLPCIAATISQPHLRDGKAAKDDLLTSGLLPEDLDDLSPSQLALALSVARQDPHVVLAYVSVSGQGLKLLYWSDIQGPVAETRDAYLSLKHRRAEFWRGHGIAKCVSTGPTTLTFLSHDPDVWLNPSASPAHVSIAPSGNASKRVAMTTRSVTEPQADVDEVIARLASKGLRWQLLYAGNSEELVDRGIYHSLDQSSSGFDLSLANVIAEVTDDPDLIRAVMISSTPYADGWNCVSPGVAGEPRAVKWDRPGYLSRTIAKAIEHGQAVRSSVATAEDFDVVEGGDAGGVGSGTGEATGLGTRKWPAEEMQMPETIEDSELAKHLVANYHVKILEERLAYWDAGRWVQEGARISVARAVRTMLGDIFDIKDRTLRALLDGASDKEAAPIIRARVALRKLQSHAKGVSVTNELSQGHYGVSSENADIDLDAVGTLNGRLALGKVVGFTPRVDERPEMPVLTKRLGTSYDPDATCPQWEHFISECLSDDESLTQYMQTAMGYSLTGHTKGQCLFMLHGPSGRNGKGVVLNVLGALMGDYGVYADQGVIFRTSAVGRDLERSCANLPGKRVMIETEAPKASLHIDSLKRLTGGDVLTCRRLYLEAFSFRPQAKMWVATNERPRAIDATDSVWSRILEIPFNRSWRGKEDQDLFEKLRKELPGILNWALVGTSRWYHEKLITPPVIAKLVREYQAEEDTLGHFVQDCLTQDEGGFAESKAVYARYQSWVEESNVGFKGGLGRNKMLNQLDHKLGERVQSWHGEARGQRGYAGWAIAIGTDKEFSTFS